MPLAIVRRQSSSHPPIGALSLRDPSAARTPGGPGAPAAPETDLDRVLKFVPTEIVALYLALMPSVSGIPAAWLPLLFAAGLGLVPLVLFLDGRATGVRAPWQQYVVRTLAFVVWAMAIEWPFARWWPANGAPGLIAAGVVVAPFLGNLLLRERKPSAA